VRLPAAALVVCRPICQAWSDIPHEGRVVTPKSQGISVSFRDESQPYHVVLYEVRTTWAKKVLGRGWGWMVRVQVTLRKQLKRDSMFLTASSGRQVQMESRMITSYEVEFESKIDSGGL
jgi:hypothetical protein